MQNPLLKAALEFQPSPASRPPMITSAKLRQDLPKHLPVHYHPLNPVSFLLRAANIYPDKLAIAHPDVKHPVFYTYSVWAQRIQNLAYALIQAGIQPRDRVAVIAPNTPLIAECHHGILAARAIITPINTRLTKTEVSYILEHSASKLILIDSEYTYLIEGTRIPVIVNMDTGLASDPYEQFLANGRKYSKEKGWLGLDPETDDDAPATLCYTSGTTGKPKGVLSTLKGSYLAAIANAFETKMTKESVYLWVLPMFHAAGWTFPWSITFACAAQITMRSVMNAQIWNHFLHSNISHYCGAPTVQIGIANYPQALKLPKPIVAVIAGSAPTAHLLEELEKLNIQPVHVYGATETYGPFTKSYEQASWKVLDMERRARLMARQGHAFVTAQEARVIHQGDGDDVVDVPADGKTIGEVVTRGNIVMKEYFNDPEATRKAFRGGYYHTGDLAVMHLDGSISIVDRNKDIIISGGENASSLAIELELATHPDVLEVAVVARPHAKWGERPMAFVTLHSDSVEKWKGRHHEFTDALKKYGRTRLPGFANPEWVKVVDELPKTSTGKILKSTLRGIVAKL